MFFRKKGEPEVNELVICTVKKILPHCAFVDLDEYENKEAMLHISEVSSKWIKNIKEFVTEGKKIVCKILQINREKGYIDVSLKRTSNIETQKKMNEVKLEIKIEKLIEVTAKKLKEDPKQALINIGTEIIKKYETLNNFYNTAKELGTDIILDLEMPQAWKDVLMLEIGEQLKCQMVMLKKELNVTCNANEGIDYIKEFLGALVKNLETAGATCIKIKYVSAPKYALEYTSQNFKVGDQMLRKVISSMEKIIKDLEINFNVAES